jgi:AraC-like DNA-binding protein
LGLATFNDEGFGKGITVLANSLKQLGFDLMQKPGQVLVERIKETIRNLVRSGKLESLHINLSAYLEDELGKDYSTLTHLFGSIEKISLEKYTILQKIEQAKEWLHNEQLTMSEIASKLGYSSAAYFSNQFRKITNFTPSEYRSLKPFDRIGLDLIGA